MFRFLVAVRELYSGHGTPNRDDERSERKVSVMKNASMTWVP
jgi:hypothetical protein